MTVNETPCASLRITWWRDAIDVDHSFEPTSPYAELVWLPRVGPASLVMWQHLCWRLRHDPDGVTVNIDDLAGALGLGLGRGISSPVWRTLARLERFGAVKAQAGGYAVRPRLPFLTDRQLAKVPATARRTHTAIVDPQRRNSRASGQGDGRASGDIALCAIRSGRGRASVETATRLTQPRRTASVNRRRG